MKHQRDSSITLLPPRPRGGHLHAIVQDIRFHHLPELEGELFLGQQLENIARMRTTSSANLAFVMAIMCTHHVVDLYAERRCAFKTTCNLAERPVTSIFDASNICNYLLKQHAIGASVPPTEAVVAGAWPTVALLH